MIYMPGSSPLQCALVASRSRSSEAVANCTHGDDGGETKIRGTARRQGPVETLPVQTPSTTLPPTHPHLHSPTAAPARNVSRRFDISARPAIFTATGRTAGDPYVRQRDSDILFVEHMGDVACGRCLRCRTRPHGDKTLAAPGGRYGQRLYSEPPSVPPDAFGSVARRWRRASPSATGVSTVTVTVRE